MSKVLVIFKPSVFFDNYTAILQHYDLETFQQALVEKKIIELSNIIDVMLQKSEALESFKTRFYEFYEQLLEEFPHHKHYHLSLEKFDQFSELPLQIKIKLAKDLLSIIYFLINKEHYIISIDLKNIFDVPKLFSSQLARMILLKNFYSSPFIEILPSKIQQRLMPPGMEPFISVNISFNSIKTMQLKNIYFFKSAIEMLIKLPDLRKYASLSIMGLEINQEDEIDLLLNPDYWKHVCSKPSELIILIKLELPFTKGLQEKIHQLTINFVQYLGGNFRPHFLILTNPEALNYSFADLAPSKLELENKFSPLSHEMGWYLSSPEIFNIVFKIRQHNINTTDLSELFKSEEQPTPISTFKIHSKEHQSLDLRLSKHHKVNPSLQLNAQINHLTSLNQQQVISAQQIYAIQQQKTHQLAQSVQQTQNFVLFQSSFNFEQFLIYTQQHARKITANSSELKAWVIRNSILTEHFNQTYFWEKILKDEEFRFTIVTRLFGMAYTKTPAGFQAIYLEKTSIDLIKKIEIDFLMQILPIFQAGLTYEIIGNVSIQAFSFTGIAFQKKILEVNYSFLHRTLINLNVLNNFKVDLFPSPFTSFSSHKSHAYQGHWHYKMFFSNTEIKSFSQDEIELIKIQANEIFTIFNYSCLSQDEFNAFQEKFILFFSNFYQLTEECQQLKKLFGYFEKPSPDYLKSLIYLCLAGGKPKLIRLIEVIEYLETHHLLKTFYILFFKYAHHVSFLFNQINHDFRPSQSTVPDITITNNFKFEEQFLYYLYYTEVNSELFGNQHKLLSFIHKYTLAAYETQKGNITTFYFNDHSDLFLKFIQRYSADLSAGKNIEKIQFFCKIYEYLFQSNSNTIGVSDRLNKYLNSILATIAQHHGVEQSEDLLLELYQKLSAPEGLVIKPGVCFDTLTHQLEFLVHHTISKGTYKEQIENLKDLSFFPYDAPYAFMHNHYNVITPEMEIYARELDPLTKSYYISREQLQSYLHQYSSNSNFFKRTIFRYLGSELLRESIQFYRQIFATLQTFKIPGNCEQKKLIDLIFGFVVLKTTNLNYQLELKSENLFEEFKITFKHHSFIEETTIDLKKLFDDIITISRKTPNDKSKNITTLWQLLLEEQSSYFVDSSKKTSEIFTFKFEQKKLIDFLTQYQPTIIAELQKLNHQEKLIKRFWNLLFDTSKASKSRLAISIIKKLYTTELDLTQIIVDIKNIQKLLKLYHDFMNEIDYKSSIYLKLKQLFNYSFGYNQAFQVLELLYRTSNDFHEESFCQFLEVWSQYPQIPYSSMIEAIFNALIKHNRLHLEHVNDIFLFLDKFNTLNEKTTLEYLNFLLEIFPHEPGYLFFKRQQTLSLESYDIIFNILSKTKNNTFIFNALDFLLGQEDKKLQLEKFQNCLSPHSQKHILISLEICEFYDPTNFQFSLLESVIQLPTVTIHQLQRLCQLNYLTAAELSTLLAAENVAHSIQQFEIQAYQVRRHEFTSPLIDVHTRIEQIFIKNELESTSQKLSTANYELLLNDYKKIMSMLYEEPILIEKNQDENKTYIISELSQFQIQKLFQYIKNNIHHGNKQKYYSLIAIGLGCEVLFRTLGKFPRDTQLMTVLISLHQPGNIIHEMKTGEGKSIASTLNALLLVLEGFSVDMITKNATLAQNMLDTFSPFFNYFGIPTSTKLIHMKSAASEYQTQGINFSTTSDLALFRLQQQLESNLLPEKIALVWDEVDAELSSSVDFRLASVINTAFYNKKQCKELFTVLLDFVMDTQLFMENYCSSKEDVENFRLYFIQKKPSKESQQFLNSLSSEYLELFIESATIALQLESGKDYVIVTQTELGKQYSYAAPYLDSTKRPDPRLSFSHAIQQILHLRLQNNSTKLAPFKIEEITETLTSMSAKNFFDQYHLNGGRVLSFTGTAGSQIELKEFHHTHGLTTYHYPTFHQDKSENLGLQFAFNETEHYQLILSKLVELRSKSTQPILIIASTPAETEKIHSFLTAHTSLTLQFFIGDESNGINEELLVINAGKFNINTISNQSLARGTDIISEHPDGLIVINTCADVTKNELEQIQGRAARNGCKGQYLSILNAILFSGLATDSQEVLENKFLQYQLHLSIIHQTKRLKIRLLNDVRYLVISHYLLKLRNIADPILKGQFGTDYCLVTYETVISTLYNFNIKLEKLFSILQEQHTEEDEFKQAFINETIKEYQLILASWLPLEKFENFSAMQPLIPLDHLNLIPKDKLQRIDLGSLSKLSHELSQLWTILGNRAVVDGIKQQKQLSSQFSAILNEKQLSLSLVLNFVISNNFITPAELQSTAEQLKQTALDLNNHSQHIPLLGRFIPKREIDDNINQYFTEILLHIQNEEWLKLYLPSINLEKIQGWLESLNKIQQGISIVSMISSFAGGPVSFLIKQILMPIVKNWCSALFKKCLKSSDSEIAHLFVGFSELSDDIYTVYQLYKDLNHQEQKLEVYLTAIENLIRNKAFVGILSAVLKSYEIQEADKLFETLQNFIAQLAPYKHLNIEELKHTDTLITILKKCFDHFEDEEKNKYFVQICKSFKVITPELIQSFATLSFHDLFNLLILMSHPEFYNFIKSLPPTTNLLEMMRWMNSPFAMIPENLKESFQKLNDFQQNQQRREQEQSLLIQTLHNRFSLTAEKLSQELEHLTPKIPENLAYISPQSRTKNTFFQQASNILNSKTLFICLGASAFIYINVVCFSYPLLACSVLFALWQAYKIYQDYIHDKKTIPTEESLIQPIEISPQAIG